MRTRISIEEPQLIGPAQRALQSQGRSERIGEAGGVGGTRFSESHNEQKAAGFSNTPVIRDTTVDGDYGRNETRTVTVFHDIGWLQDTHQWPGLKSVVMVESEREIDGKVEIETRFYITSLALLAAAVNPMIRSHWMIENGLHWVLDMVFRDDDCRLRTDNAPFILRMVKQLALNVLRTGKSKDSLRMRRKVAAWDDNALAAYLAA